MGIRNIKDFLWALSLFLWVCSCTSRALPKGNVFENRQGKEDFSLLYYNDSLDFSISYWGDTEYVIAPSLRKRHALIPRMYQKVMRGYGKKQIFVIYKQHWNTNPLRTFLVRPYGPGNPGLDACRSDLYRYLRTKKQITRIDTFLTDTSFHYDHREIRYTIKEKPSSFVDVVEYQTMAANTVCRFIFTMNRRKNYDYLQYSQFFDKNVSYIMSTYKVKIKDHLFADYVKNPGMMANNVFINTNYNYLEPLYWLSLFSGSDTLAQRKSDIELALRTYNSFIGDFKKDAVPKNDSSYAAVDTTRYKLKNATDAIMEVADSRKVIMLNEDHLNPYGRVFAKGLLAGLYQRGYRYLAVEALTYDSLLNSRKCVLKSSGFYMSEPSFGDFLRTALQLGFRLVPYENTQPCDCPDTYCRINCRAENQANNLAQIFKDDPSAKVFVYAGHQHIYKSAPDKNIRYMAERFAHITGLEPFCIDQTDLSDEAGPASGGAYYNYYRSLIHSKESFVLKDSAGAYWNQPQPKDAVDMQIIHPVTLFKDGYPDWLTNKGNHNISLELHHRDYEGSLLQVFYQSEMSDIDKNAIPLINIKLKRNNHLNILLPEDKYYIRTVNRYDITKFQKEVTIAN